MWNYWLGGKDNYQVDREVGDQVIAAFPGVREVARASRACLGRMVSYLAAEQGIRQFLDIGTGLPTSGNTHEVAQQAAPDSKVVYVDNDPLVLVHARALLASGPEGACGYIECDVRDPGRILDEAGEDPGFRPAGGRLIMFGIMGNVVDDDEAAAIVRRLTGALAPGSFLALNDGTGQVGQARPRGGDPDRGRAGLGLRMWPARRARSPASSMAWSLSSRAWCPHPCGGRRAHRRRSMRPAG